MVGDAFVICGGEGVIDLSSLLFVENGGYGLESPHTDEERCRAKIEFLLPSWVLARSDRIIKRGGAGAYDLIRDFRLARWVMRGSAGRLAEA
jgi:hypothetical protein